MYPETKLSEETTRISFSTNLSDGKKKLAAEEELFPAASLLKISWNRCWEEGAMREAALSMKISIMAMATGMSRRESQYTPWDEGRGRGDEESTVAGRAGGGTHLMEGEVHDMVPVPNIFNLGVDRGEENESYGSEQERTETRGGAG
jgi:hypothetical protein